MHGFLALRTLQGKNLAGGDVSQSVKGNEVTVRLTFHFLDGSLDDETTVFTQEREFRLVSDHHIQKGRAFPEPSDLTVDAASGKVEVRYTDKSGKEKVEQETMELPPDVSNGMVAMLLRNMPLDTAAAKLSYVAVTPKPRLVKLAITNLGQHPFSLSGIPHKAELFELKVELGGVAGVVAPVIGKEPPPVKIWIAADGTPAFVRAEQTLFANGPVWRIEMASPTWPATPRVRR